MLERLLQNRLLPFALRRGLIPRGQFGFLADVGAADAQGLASHLADSASAQGLRTFRVFIDLTKAYDKVDREALWVIMGNAGVPPLFLALVKDLHTGAMATIKQGATLSTPFLLQRGLKQGSVFAPLLFNIFLGAVLHSCESQYKLNPALGVQFQWRPQARVHHPEPDLMPWQKGFLPVHLSYIAYADDLVLMARSGHSKP